VVIVNQKQFDSLDKSSREVLLKAAAAAERRGWKTSEAKTLWYLEQLKKNGMKVLPASAALQKDLLDIGERMTREWLAQAGADGRQVYDSYRKAINK
jgi:TRAP-type C4-dicarboxylate transport system substrate-binding protein